MNSIEVSEKLREISDLDLLLELRRRGLMARFEAEFIVEGWRRDFKGSEPPREYVFTRLSRGIAEDLAFKVMTEQIHLPGKQEKELPWSSGQFPSKQKSLRYYLPVNVIVMNPSRESFSMFQRSETFIQPREEQDIEGPHSPGL